MKLSKGVWTVFIAQVVAVATVLVQRYVAPDDLAIAIAIIAMVEGIAAALVVHFDAVGKLATMRGQVNALGIRLTQLDK